MELQKTFDFVSSSRNITVNINKTKIAQIMWHNDFQWLCNKYRVLEENFNDLCNNKKRNEAKSSMIIDKRINSTFPQTTNKNYGWLIHKPDFQLEKYGNFCVKNSNPMDKIIVLYGDIPVLTGGKGLF